MSSRECTVDGCGRTHYGRGLCGMHYQRWKNGGEVGPAGTVKVANVCRIPGCTDPCHGLGYCLSHYKRLRRHGDPLLVQRIPGLDFWSRVDKSGECWTWTGTRDRNGYGRCFGAKYGLGHSALAHRASWLLTHGSLDPKDCVLHRCDNPPCVRPDHLFLGTRADNTRDMVAKGRGKFGAQPWESRTHGTRNAHAKLTEAAVVEMRQRAAAGEQYKDLAVDYGISASRANAIIIGNGWRHVWPYGDAK